MIDFGSRGVITSIFGALVFVAGLLVLAVRLRTVQVDYAAYYNLQNDHQSVRRIQTAGVRGRILDRNGEVLADNREAVSIVIYPEVFQRVKQSATIEAIAEAIASLTPVIGRKSTVTIEKIRRHVRVELARPLVVWRDISFEELARFEEHADGYPGFDSRTEAVRRYPGRTLAAHLIGFTGRSKDQVSAGDESFKFLDDDLAGSEGLERYYDAYLRGVPGEEKVRVDARGFKTEVWTVVAPERGPDLVLSLDARLQRAVEHELEGLVGACVVMNPVNGEVLALASSPVYDLSRCVPFFPRAYSDELAADKAKPRLNRAVNGLYAPGSTFKPVTALAGLNSRLPASYTYFCNGYYMLGRQALHCARRWGHGDLDVREALRDSCNPFFCNWGVMTGTNALCRAAHALGLGEPTGLDYVNVRGNEGVVPDAVWKKLKLNEPWYPGDLAHMSIGQGQLLVSPLQMARVAGAIGTGRLVTPHLKLDYPVKSSELPFSAYSLQTVREGMRMVVTGEGTGWRGAKGVHAYVLGKTGTAEVGSRENRHKNTWFIAYAKSDSSTDREGASGAVVSVAMVIENGESGGGTTAPKVANVLKAVFNAPEESEGTEVES